MVRIFEEPYAPSKSYRPTGVIRSRAGFPVFTCVAKVQFSNVPVRGCRATGVQAHLSCRSMSSHVERGTPGPSPFMGRLTVRQAVGGLGREAYKKRMPCCNGGDTGCNIPGSVRRLTFGWCLVTRTQRGSVVWGKAIDGLRAGAPPGFGYADCLVVS